MGVGSFELRDIEWTTAKFALVMFSLATAGIHFAIAAATDNHAFAVLAVGLLAGFVVFFTDLWEPVLYLVGAIYVGIMTVVWVFAGMPLLRLGLIDKSIQLALFGLFVYLLISETGSADSSR